MALLETKRERAGLLLLVLGLGIVVALAPYATGLLGIPVLYVVFEPVHAWLAKHLRPQPAASVVVAIVLAVILIPGASFAGLIVTQAHDIAAGVIRSPVLQNLAQVRIGTFDVGSQLAGLGSRVAEYLGSSALGLVGTATRFALNLTISLFGLFYLLLRPADTWSAIQPYIPFSAKNTEKLRARFRDVTTSTIIGTGLTAAIQGTLLGLGFRTVGLSNALFWSVVAMVFAILPVVGSGLVWGPAAIVLAVQHRLGAAVGLALWGVIVVGNVDYLIRPMVFRRWAHIHPLVTLVGAIAGVPYLGLLGLLIGPLAVSYLFELIKMYGEEYLT